MAEKKRVTEDPEQVDFELVIQPYSSPSQTRRRIAGVAVSRTGYTETNANGTAEIEKLITSLGGKVEDLIQLKFGANESKALLAAYVAAEGEPGATTVKRSKNKKLFSFHLGHIFDKYPSLRPAGDLFCQFKLSHDKTGTPCIVINLRGTAIRKGRTSSAAPAAAAKAVAAGQQQ